MPLETNDIDIRDAFFDEINRLAAQDRNVLLLTDDQDAFSLQWMRDHLPDQYFNLGIAEQNIISVAGGLALAGKIPFAYGIATFMTMRCFEQIRNDLCCMNLPVTIVASGAGFSYSEDGPTHHAAQDVAIMRALPDITILNPPDAESTVASARISYNEPGPKYIRLERGTLGKIYEEGHDFSKGFDVLLDGEDLYVVSTGVMVHEALRVAEELADYKVRAGVIDVHRLKPVDGESLIDAMGNVPRIVTLEEHSIIGGLGSLVCETAADYGLLVPIKRFGIPDSFVYQYGSREWLRDQVGLGLAGVVSGILQWLSSGATSVALNKS